MKQLTRLLPTFGIVIFIGLYIYAASLYPGGSPEIPDSTKWDWFKNLWCNLMLVQAINGLENPARPVAIFAVVVLSSSIAVFYFYCTKYFVKSQLWKIVIKISGILLVLSASFIFSKYHDLMTTILSLCGLVGIIGILRALYQNKMIFFMVFGLVCLLVIGLNNLFYYSGNEWLPLIEQLNFLLILSWTVALNVHMLHMKEITYL